MANVRISDYGGWWLDIRLKFSVGGGGTTYEWLYDYMPLSFLTISDCKESISRNEIEMKPPTPMQQQCNSVSILMSVQRI